MKLEKEKPVGREAGWKLIETEQVFANKVCKLRDDHLELKNGDRMHYAYVERADAVIIVTVTDAGEVVLLNQYRYPVDEWCLEVPAGGTHDAGKASLEEVVRKELREEIGATGGKLTYVTYFYSANAMMNEKSHVFLAAGVKLEKRPKREASESIMMELKSIGEALDLARSGKMKTGPCALALLLCEPRLRQLG